jgi:hypothetical protein
MRWVGAAADLAAPDLAAGEAADQGAEDSALGAVLAVGDGAAGKGAEDGAGDRTLVGRTGALDLARILAVVAVLLRAGCRRRQGKGAGRYQDHARGEADDLAHSMCPPHSGQG